MRKLKIDLVTLHFLDRRDACCFGNTFGTGAEFWLELQESYENEQRAQRNGLLHEGVTKLLFAPKEPQPR